MPRWTGTRVRLLMPPPDQNGTAVMRQRKPGRRAPVHEPRSARFNVRCKPGFRDAVAAEAKAAGFASLSAFVCMRLGEDGTPSRIRSTVSLADRQLLARALGELGKVGSNHNQLARRQNISGEEPELAEWQRIEAVIQDIRCMLLEALGRAR
jgi:hypothetical protein